MSTPAYLPVCNWPLAQWAAGALLSTSRQWHAGLVQSAGRGRRQRQQQRGRLEATGACAGGERQSRVAQDYVSAESVLAALRRVDPAKTDLLLGDVDAKAAAVCGQITGRRAVATVPLGNGTLRLSANDAYLVVPSRGFKTRAARQRVEKERSDWLQQLLGTKATSAGDTLVVRVPKQLRLATGGAGQAKTAGGSTAAAAPATDASKLAFAEGYLAGARNPEGHKDDAQTKWKKRVRSLVLAGLVVYILYELSNGLSKTTGIFSRVRYEPVAEEQVTVLFSDVRGADEAKEDLEEVVSYLRDTDKYTALGGRLPKGVLLVGGPGTGKTLLARAVAGEAQVPFFHASGSEFDEMLVGQGAKRVRELFAAAKARAPCVVFIDEIDSVGSKRVTSNLHPYANQTVNQLLTEMDGFEKNEGVVVVGATNRREDLDKALLRPGRFDVEVEITRPDLKGRLDIFNLYLGKIKTCADVDASSLAKRTTGLTGADIENLVNQAALHAATDDCHCVNMHYLHQARDRMLMGRERKSGRLPDEETNKITAYHEAGHTLVAYYTPGATQLHKVTILPRGGSLGHTAFVHDKDEYLVSKKQLLAQIDTAMGGRAGEELVFGKEAITTGAGSDVSAATDIATEMVKAFGMSDKAGMRDYATVPPDALVVSSELSPQTAEIVDAEIRRILHESYERARDILRSHSKELHRLADALLLHETLDRDEIADVLAGKPIREADAETEAAAADGAKTSGQADKGKSKERSVAGAGDKPPVIGKVPGLAKN